MVNHHHHQQRGCPPTAACDTSSIGRHHLDHREWSCPRTGVALHKASTWIPRCRVEFPPVGGCAALKTDDSRHSRLDIGQKDRRVEFAMHYHGTIRQNGSGLHLLALKCVQLWNCATAAKVAQAPYIKPLTTPRGATRVSRSCPAPHTMLRVRPGSSLHKGQILAVPALL